MLDRWKYRIEQASNRCWITAPPNALKRIGNQPKDLGSQLRQLHDHWGYCAKKGINCSGAIYRTKAFIDIPKHERLGTKGGTVHIEHTVPINSLRKQIESFDIARQWDIKFMLGWLLRHSVTCAFARGTEKFHSGYSINTNAFKNNHIHRNKPFSRYLHLTNQEISVWNVWTGQKVDIEAFTFDEHAQTVKEILSHLGAAESTLRLL